MTAREMAAFNSLRLKGLTKYPEGWVMLTSPIVLSSVKAVRNKYGNLCLRSIFLARSMPDCGPST